jgi:hypothetical protein
MGTARTIVTDAQKLLGVWEKGSSLDATEGADGLRKLNGLIETLNNEYLMIYQTVQRTHALTAGTAQYTIGSGGTISTTRPLRIDSAYTRDSSSIDHPITIINNQEWSEISYKPVGNTYPTVLYYRPNYPLGAVNLYPEPSSGLTLYMECWDQIASFATIDTSASLPPAYEYMLTYNLAVVWSPDFEVDPKPIVVSEAQRSKAAIKDTNNTRIPILKTPFTRRRGFGTLDSILG